MKIFWLMIILTCPLVADFKTVPPLPSTAHKDQPPAINVNFTMGNSQEAPVQNSATSTTKKIHIEHKMDPFPQESMFSKIKNSFIGGAAAALGSAAAYKIMENSGTVLEFVKIIVFRG